MFDLRRREFITLLGGAVTAWPLAARAQQPNRRTRPVLGYLVTGTEAGYASLTTPFLHRLREIGYTDGRNIDIITRYADADITRLPSLADELVRLQPDVIVAIDPPAAFAAKKSTASLPIVAAILNDPVRLGMIASYARPGGNVTGILSQVEGLPGKQVEIAREVVPGLTVLGVLVNPANATHAFQRQEIEAAAMSSGVKIVAVEVRSKADLEPAFKALHAAGVRAGVVLRDFLFFNEFRSIAELAKTLKLATIASQNTYVEAGGLVSYGVDDSENHRRAADFVDRILKGSKPADLPVEFSTKLVTSINMRTAKALDLTIPPTLLAIADEVIE
jgi:putative tryptophan/tyrosine transport system substrate-binding protein